jgi:hypothetical protein
MPWFGSAIEQPGCQRAIAGAGSKSARSTVISMDAREQLRILSHRAELFFSAGILRSSVIFVIFVALMAYKQDQAAAPQGGCDETPTQCRRRGDGECVERLCLCRRSVRSETACR